MSNLRKARRLFASGHYGTLLKVLRRWWRTDALALGLEYDPAVPVRARILRADVAVRPLEPSDISIFTDTSLDHVTGADVLVRVNAQHLIDSGLQTCYVGIAEGQPVYMQYLVRDTENERIQAAFGGLFPRLGPREAMLEFAFTLETHRGRAIMPAVLVRLIEIARNEGVERLVTYVSCDEPSFIRFFIRLGFEPFALRIERRRLFRRRFKFEPLNQEDVGRRLGLPGGLEEFVDSHRSLLARPPAR